MIESDSFYQELRQIIIRASLATRFFFRNKNFKVQKKADLSPLTSADLCSDQILRSGLNRISNQAYYLSEETIYGDQRKSFEYVWVVDPIDGTREFSNDVPEYSISVGLVQNHLPIVGFISIPEESLLICNLLKQAVVAFKINYSDLDQKLQESIASVPNPEPAAIARLVEKMTIEETLISSINLIEHPVIDDIYKAKIAVSVSEYQDGLFLEYEKLGLAFEPEGSIARKLALLAYGKSDMVISLRPKNEWDICAGHALVQSIPGFSMRDLKIMDTQKYNQDNLRSFGVVAGPKNLVDSFCEIYNSLN